MNRFTKDMATIDDMLPLVLFDLIQVGLGPIHIHILYWCYINLYTSYNNPALDLLKYELGHHMGSTRSLTSVIVYYKYDP